jgi:thioredoxin reductase (NADPH)
VIQLSESKFSAAEVAFLKLDESQIECVASLGRLRRFRDGEALFETGDRNYPFFVVKSGEVAIKECSSGEVREVVTHREREFTGDVDLLTGRPAIVSAFAKGECEAYELSAQNLRRLLGEVPSLSDMLLEAFQTRRELLKRSGFVGVRLVGESNSKEIEDLREFFRKNFVPHTFYDADEKDGAELLQSLGHDRAETPVIACNKRVVSKPSLGEIAECLGISRTIRNETYDVAIVGAGPSGLAAAVYAGSEGLRTLVLDRVGPGGQAGQSSKIENYLGFPSGLSGEELANRGYLQALKFGVEFTSPVGVRSIAAAGDELRLSLCTEGVVRARSVIVSTGVSYRRLPIENCGRFEGAGVHYSATSVQARGCSRSTAIVVGGGNSAGQAAMFLSEFADRVLVVIRGNNLRKSMSEYLARRIDLTANVEVLSHCEIEALEGEDRLQETTIRDHRTGEVRRESCASVFVFIGAKPHTEWLPASVARDDRGYVLTGPMLRRSREWTLDRDPCELETSLPGVFAAGDCRSGTTKRCAFAVGDGALAVTCVHQRLAELAGVG